jgi:cellulose synthase/poly-beta-1,6-N-acetylglucosamine synthase-like glycosyltransferase
MTKWIDVLFQVPVCSEECGGRMWANYRADKGNDYYNFDEHFEFVKQELKWAEAAQDASKDILIIVRDQLRYVQECLETVWDNTDNYHIYVWDNGSGSDTASYLQSEFRRYCDLDDPRRKLTIVRASENQGFLEPNNRLAEKCEGDYMILLNSDCKVFEKWADAMVGFLQHNPEYAQVGFWGGHMDKEGRGFGGTTGDKIDYVPGWCFAISRETYQDFGLFDEENLEFAYCEDADLSLRLKEAGKKIYALHAPLCHHYQNKTITTVAKEGDHDVAATFQHNHEYMSKRWADYISSGRVLLKRKEAENA